MAQEEIIFPNNIRNIRLANGMKMTELARQAGLSLSAVSKRARDKRRFSSEKRRRSPRIPSPCADLRYTFKFTKAKDTSLAKRENDVSVFLFIARVRVILWSSNFGFSTFALRSAVCLISLNQGNLHGNKPRRRSNLKPSPWGRWIVKTRIIIVELRTQLPRTSRSECAVDKTDEVFRRQAFTVCFLPHPPPCNYIRTLEFAKQTRGHFKQTYVLGVFYKMPCPPSPLGKAYKARF